MYDNEYTLCHYGVKGMKWGVRRSVEGRSNYTRRIVRPHGGPGVYFGTKRQLAGDKKDLDYMNKGGHLSIGIGKKRQAALDARDRGIIEKRIAKNEAMVAKQAAKKALKKLEKQSVKELMKRYGELEDQYTYGKNADAKKNAQLDKEMRRLENEMNKR